MVELFAADIRQIAPRADELILLLDEERQKRVRSYGASKEALRCLAAGLLLYDAFGDRARNAHFEHGKRGKPFLTDHRPFNITHAGDYAVLALSGETVGVDLERVRPINWSRVAERFFHPDEQRFLAESDDPQTMFFLIWTLKESYLKAEGQGFSVSPRSFCILPRESGAELQNGSGYRFRSYPAFPGYCLSVCYREQEIVSDVIKKVF
ncbi:MAG: 4'-phosphopantetheinyl transferase superfamily protein [Clostridiaceae bacterium]